MDNLFLNSCVLCVWYCPQIEKRKRDCSKSPKSISSWKVANVTQPFNVKCHENWAVCQLIRMSCIFLKLSTTLYRTLEHSLWQWTCTYWHEKCHEPLLIECFLKTTLVMRSTLKPFIWQTKGSNGFLIIKTTNWEY